ncbi:unnamed protein product, partial [Hymenolepis diminuta]
QQPADVYHHLAIRNDRLAIRSPLQCPQVVLPCVCTLIPKQMSIITPRYRQRDMTDV